MVNTLFFCIKELFLPPPWWLNELIPEIWRNERSGNVQNYDIGTPDIRPILLLTDQDRHSDLGYLKPQKQLSIYNPFD